MIELRKARDRGHADHGWLRSAHSFSFADYYDPQHMSYGALRVINDDHIEPGTGFGTHGHRDMEIVTYILAGELEHKDSLGTGSIIRPGDVQRMSAGKGVMHSEFNPSREHETHLLQIWILPAVQGGPASYEQKAVPDGAKRGRLALIAGPQGGEHAVTIQQDACVYAALIDGAERAVHVLAPGRRVYLHVARGSVEANGTRLEAGDALKCDQAGELRLAGGSNAEVLLFDLA